MLLSTSLRHLATRTSTYAPLHRKMSSSATTLSAPYSRLVRFLPASSSSSSAGAGTPLPLIGEPTSPTQDVGLAARAGEPITVSLFSGSSILAPGQRTGETATVGRLLSPLAQEEAGTIRCIGINYIDHTAEVKMELPKVPVLFMKPATAVNDPWPAKTYIPKAYVGDEAADYESEIAIVLSKAAKNVPESEALDYLLGFTAANDVSSRVAQFAQSQWCYSKSFDGACPLGPAFVHRDAVPRQELANMRVTGALNGQTVQDGTLDLLIFSIPRLISFLSQGTTLPKGTVILTGTPAGVGWTRSPRLVLKNGDTFSVAVSHGVGTLVSEFANEE